MMRKLDNADKLALMQVANYDCMETADACTNCPYYAEIHKQEEDYYYGSCISIYLKQIVDKYYTEKETGCK